jgi:hypothetical protein
MGKWIIGAIVVFALISGSSSDEPKSGPDLPEVVEAATGTEEADAAEREVARAARRAEARRQARREARAEARRVARAQARREARAAARREARREAEQERAQALAAAAETSECDENYSGCLDPSSSDYDCEGGGGDGPDYTGLVNVRGTDIHELDRDGDGIACDTY